MARKVQPKLDIYTVMARAIDEGIAWGLSRHDKHAETPLTETQHESLSDHLARELMNALCEVVRFDD